MDFAVAVHWPASSGKAVAFTVQWDNTAMPDLMLAKELGLDQLEVQMAWELRVTHTLASAVMTASNSFFPAQLTGLPKQIHEKLTTLGVEESFDFGTTVTVGGLTVKLKQGSEELEWEICSLPATALTA